MIDIINFLKNGKACIGTASFLILITYLFLGPSHTNPDDFLSGIFEPLFKVARQGIYIGASILFGWGIFKEFSDNS